MKSKKAAMEMSVGTIVTIVLLMSVLVLGIFLVQKVFRSGTNAIDSIDDQVQNEIAKLFAEEDLRLVIYPTSRDITLKKGDESKGFAFSVKNKGTEAAAFSYEVSAEPSFDFEGRCGSGFSKSKADYYLLKNSGDFELGPGNAMGLAEIVRFSIPEDATPCTIPYRIQVDKEQVAYEGATVFVTIK